MKKMMITATVILFAAHVVAQQQPPKPPSKEERMKHVSEQINKEISLTAAQKTKVQAAYSEFFDSMDKLREKNKDKMKNTPPPPPPPGPKEEVDKLVKVRDARIKATLNDAQYKKYTEVEKTLHPPKPGEGPGKPPADKKP